MMRQWQVIKMKTEMFNDLAEENARVEIYPQHIHSIQSDLDPKMCFSWAFAYDCVFVFVKLIQTNCGTPNYQIINVLDSELQNFVHTLHHNAYPVVLPFHL